MKDFLKKYFGILGTVMYYVIATIVRIPVFFFLAMVIICLLLIWNPVMRRDDNPNWINSLYSWYNAE